MYKSTQQYTPMNMHTNRGEATYMVADAHAPTAKEKSRVNYPKF